MLVIKLSQIKNIIYNIQLVFHIESIYTSENMNESENGNESENVNENDEHHQIQLDEHIQKQRHIKAGDYIKSAVYGGLDGLITTLNVALSGVGLGYTAGVVVALGLASLIGDAISMAVADYLATKSDQQYMKTEQQRERRQIEQDFEGQKQQMVHIYIQMGLQNKVAKQIVEILSEKKQGFLKIMMIEELQLIADQQNPLRNSMVTFFSFCIFGLMPLIPYIIAHSIHNEGTNNFAFTLSTVLISLFFLFLLGFSKSFVTSAKWYYSALQTIIIGAISSGAAFGMGTLLGG